MDDADLLVFSALFKDAYSRCFGEVLGSALTETESKIFCNKILEQTGLSIGWKSMKNYSFYVTCPSSAKAENPSAATLDTLARYVLRAPHTNEIQRKDNESHYPYWFLYKEKFRKPNVKASRRRLRGVIAGLAGLAVIILLLLCLKLFTGAGPTEFTDDFKDLRDASMQNKGWMLRSYDAAWWNKRSEKPGELTLFTLKGDNWPDPASKPVIRNLLMRRITTDRFTAEVHLDDFIPVAEWQQAGILLLEDSLLTGKSIRLSLAYNDNFGGRKMPDEVYVQAITSLGNGFGKPEELAHKPVFYPDSARIIPGLAGNLKHTSLRIEKHGSNFRFLYSGGARENGAFREIAAQQFDMKPAYIALFAIRGFTDSGAIPVHFKFFRITGDRCN